MDQLNEHVCTELINNIYLKNNSDAMRQIVAKRFHENIQKYKEVIESILLESIETTEDKKARRKEMDGMIKNIVDISIEELYNEKALELPEYIMKHKQETVDMLFYKTRSQMLIMSNIGCVIIAIGIVVGMAIGCYHN